MIVKPSQYDIDNINDNDLFYVYKRNIRYKVLRFILNKLLSTPTVVVTYNGKQYNQDDCIIFRSSDLLCQQQLDNVICNVTKGKIFKNTTTTKLPKVTVTLYSINITFKNGNILSIPINKIQNSINKNTLIFNTIDKQQIIKDEIKYIRYKGDWYKNAVSQYNIKSWTPSYCYLCGKPLVYTFTNNGIDVINKCDCGFNKVEQSTITYDELALWCDSQTNKSIINQYNKFWHR